MHTGFIDYGKFIRDLERAINDQREAAEFYDQLLGMTDNEKYMEYIKEARDDERLHYRILSELFMRLTGKRPRVTQPEAFTGCFAEGIQRAFDDELEAYIQYRDMILNTMIADVRDVIFVPFTDENEHAQKFNWILADLKSENHEHHKKHKHHSSS
jgi:rubrerythrin